MKYLILLLVSFSCLAEKEVGISYMRVNQDLFGTISFPMDAAQLSYSYILDNGVGVKLIAGKSTETANSLYVEGFQYQNKIDSLFSGIVFYRHRISDKHSLDFGFGKTDYKSTWKVNGDVPEWGDNSADSDWSYHLNYHYKTGDNTHLNFGYSDIYRKHKEGYGREETRVFEVGFVYGF